MNKVYIVSGETGEYEDYRSWGVAAYGDEEQAKTHADNLNLIVQTVTGGDLRSTTITELEDEIKKRIRHLDPHFRMDYNGTRYGVSEIGFFVHFDQFQELRR